jgi:VanZ family protein
MSSGHTSRFIGPVVRWFVPDISEAALGRVVLGIRKAAHGTEYAVLALLWWRAWHKSYRNNASEWRWADAFLALGIVALYAASDEFHQSFVPTREARFGDVLIDTAGAAVGLLCLWSLGRWRRRW